LAGQLHPDKNKDDPDAESKFQELANAYEVLSDTEKRRIYDRDGEDGLKNNGQQQQGGFGNDIFSRFFGGGRQRETDSRGPDITINLPVTLEDIYTGNMLEIGIKNMVLCPRCRGSGAEDDDDVVKCRKCNGQGFTMKQRRLGPGFIQNFQEQCGSCGGKGKIVRTKCSRCKGEKVVKGARVVDIPIEQGIPNGEKITFENAADEQADKAAGHVIFECNQLPHDRFRRDDNSVDLHTDVHVSLKEALTGFSTSIPHLDGHPVDISRKKVTQPFQVLKIQGEGMPQHNWASQKGDLYVRVIVDFPSKLTQDQKQKFAQLL
jgi:DnaJ-class molecular chaperone